MRGKGERCDLSALGLREGHTHADDDRREQRGEEIRFVPPTLLLGKDLIAPAEFAGADKETSGLTR